MKKIILLITIFFFCFTALVTAEVQNDNDLLKILNNPKIIKDKYSPDPNVKIIKMTFTKKESNEWVDMWEVETTLKSCYKMNVSCTVNGYFEYSDDYYYEQRDVWGLFFNNIDKQSTKTDFKTPIKILKKKEKYIDLFKISITCSPLPYEHPPLPGDDKYWKQFAPGKCE